LISFFVADKVCVPAVVVMQRVFSDILSVGTSRLNVGDLRGFVVEKNNEFAKKTRKTPMITVVPFEIARTRT